MAGVLFCADEVSLFDDLIARRPGVGRGSEARFHNHRHCRGVRSGPQGARVRLGAARRRAWRLLRQPSGYCDLRRAVQYAWCEQDSSYWHGLFERHEGPGGNGDGAHAPFRPLLAVDRRGSRRGWRQIGFVVFVARPELLSARLSGAKGQAGPRTGRQCARPFVIGRRIACGAGRKP